MKKNYNFIYYSLPTNLIISSIRNPDLSNDVRLYLLKTSFYFLIKLLYELQFLKSPPHSRIGVIRLINTLIGISVSINMNNYVRLGHIGTHALEIFFGFLRLSCHYDHSCQNIFRTIGKTVLIKKAIYQSF